MTKAKCDKLNMSDLAMDWALVEPRKRFKTATDYAYYLEKDFTKCYEQGKKDEKIALLEWANGCKALSFNQKTKDAFSVVQMHLKEELSEE